MVGACFAFLSTARGIGILLSLSILIPTTTLTMGSQTSPSGTVEAIVVHGTALEGNLNGDPADRNVVVYLPPGYAADTARRYPVVYLLHGYGLTVDRWMGFARVENGANQAMTGSGNGDESAEMIIVNPDAYSIYDGSMYSSSVTAGDWETFIAEDLVNEIDRRYRTIPNRMSRGLAGHSMGGYGALRIAMKRPDVFSAIYPMSACCLLEGGEPDPEMQAAQAPRTREEVAELRYPDKRIFARAAAWSPNPTNPPFYFDLPVRNGVPQPEIQAKWLANSPLAMIDQYTANLRKLTAIQLDVGVSDDLLGVNRQLDAALTQAGIDHVFETYDGSHNDRVFERIETKVLPFFSRHLELK